MHVKTRMGLEKFEVGKYRNRYVPLRSCLGKGRCRPVNKIPRANICLNVDAGCNWRGAPPVCRPPSYLVVMMMMMMTMMIQKFSLNRLKLEYFVTDGLYFHVTQLKK